jgi:hypothetical protein
VRPSPATDHPVARRSFLKAAGAATVLPAVGSERMASGAGPGGQMASKGGKTNTTTSLYESTPGKFSVGGQHVVGVGGYPTIQAAWDDAADGDTVYVHSSYDAQAAGEEFPITLDFRQKEVLLMGGHPSGSVIDASHTTENVIEVIGKGHEDYRNNPLVQNLKVVGGGVGLRIQAAPYASFKDLVFWMTGSHGVMVDGFQANGTDYGTFGVTFRNCMAWNCGGDGFRLNTGAQPHSTSFYGCHALLNRQVGLRLRGYASRWHGGTIQNNGDFGIDARSGGSQVVQGTYFEGNGTYSSAPIEVYVDDSAKGFTIRDSYFQGGFFRNFPNGRSIGRWGVVVAGAPNVDVSHCSFRNYSDSFLSVRDATDVDVHLASHCALDETTLVDHSGCTRLRSDGTALPADLRSAGPGHFVGDRAIHDGSGALPWGPAVWNGSAWVSLLSGTAL